MMMIQYVGFQVRAHSRAYDFLVTDVPAAPREFIVSIELTAFSSAGLKFQDGPDICFSRLKRELEQETEEVRANLNLLVAGDDVQAYVDRHRPPKRSWRSN